MKLVVVSDVHGNIEALDAVLRDADAAAPGATLVCAGDVVGYGPDPEACIRRLRARGALCVLGNHEEMVLGRRDFSRCVHAGIVAAVWTREQGLSAEARAFIAALPPWRAVTAEVVVCHGDLTDAARYVSEAGAAAEALLQLREVAPDARVLVCGHTHHAALYGGGSGFDLVPPDGERRLPDGPALLNPGAVGQARERGAQPAARYAIVDLAERVVRFRAVAYPYHVTLRKMRRAGLVDRVVLAPPRGFQRRVEAWKAQLARRWAEQRPASPSG